MVLDKKDPLLSSFTASDVLLILRNKAMTPCTSFSSTGKKAFDKIDHTKMFISLARLGISDTILNNIKALYKNPTFKVVQGIHESQWCQQRTGIRQGCPLSPYLFILTMHAMFRILEGHTTIHTIEKHSKGLIFKNFCTQIIP